MLDDFKMVLKKNSDKIKNDKPKRDKLAKSVVNHK
jgi:hypothetical protein